MEAPGHLKAIEIDRTDPALETGLWEASEDTVGNTHIFRAKDCLDTTQERKNAPLVDQYFRQRVEAGP